MIDQKFATWTYKTKQGEYTKQEVDAMLKLIKQFTYETVAELPIASEATMWKIYMVPSANSDVQNVKDEYITISATKGDITRYYWEKIGSTTADLSDYALKSDLNAYALKSELFSGSYNDLTDKPDLFSGSYNDLTDKPDLFSGSYNDLTDKPDLFSGSYNDLTDKPSLFSGSYNDLTDKPAIPTVPTNVSAFTNDAGYLTQHQDISGKADISSLAAVAFSGDYADLLNRPGIFSHNIAFYGDSNTNVYLTLITNFDTAFDIPSFIAWVNNLNSVTDAGFACTGTVRTNSSGIATGRTVARIVPGTSDSTIGILYHDTGDAGVAGPIQYQGGTGNNDIHSLTDTVVRII